MGVAEQLTAIRAELGAASAHVADLGNGVPDDAWTKRPPSGGWSAAECIAHLTLTTNAYIPLMNAARVQLPVGAALPPKYRMGFAAWLLSRSLEPPARKWSRSRTIAALVPESAAPKRATIDSFEQSQRALDAWIRDVERVPLDRVIIASPFNARLEYNAYGALRVITAHQRRHIWQAERAANGIP